MKTAKASFNQSPISNQIMAGVLSGQSPLTTQNSKKTSSGMTGLMLTSLIDAFCILVIFLLSQAQNTGTPLESQGKIQLPMSSYGETFSEGTTIRVVASPKGPLFYLGNQILEPKSLTSVLTNMKSKTSLIVQADRKIPFQDLNPIILAASHSGIEKFQFAVLPKDSK